MKLTKKQEKAFINGISQHLINIGIRYETALKAIKIQCDKHEFKELDTCKEAVHNSEEEAYLSAMRIFVIKSKK